MYGENLDGGGGGGGINAPSYLKIKKESSDGFIKTNIKTTLFCHISWMFLDQNSS